MQQLLKEMQRIGNNVNQVVRYCHEKKGMNKADYDQLVRLLNQCNQKLARILDLIERGEAK